MTYVLSTRAIYATVIRDVALAARERLWIATANTENM